LPNAYHKITTTTITTITPTTHLVVLDIFFPSMVRADWLRSYNAGGLIWLQCPGGPVHG